MTNKKQDLRISYVRGISFQLIFNQKLTERDDVYEGTKMMILSKNIKIVMVIKMDTAITIKMMTMRMKTILLFILFIVLHDT